MVIEIKSAYTGNTTPSYRTYRGKDAVERVAYNMSGLALGNYVLLINGREYPWPDVKGYSLVADAERDKIIENHIRECVELDEAFYGSCS